MQAIAIAIVTVACLAANLISDLFIAPTNKELAHGWNVVGSLGLYGGGAMLLVMGVWTLKDASEPDSEPHSEPEPAYTPTPRRTTSPAGARDVYTSSPTAN
jgi:hypothetical protein